MNDSTTTENIGDPDEAAQTWARNLLDYAVKELGNRAVFREPLIEARPVWAIPLRLMVGKARAQGNEAVVYWFIGGEVPLDHIAGHVAKTPRDVIRHFALKWQLESTKVDEVLGAQWVEHAEALHTLADDERFWQPDSTTPEST